MKYPAGHLREEHGNKVGWLVYTTEELASECSTAALINAVILSQRGYDFGYCVPGDIRKVDDGYCVTIP